MKSCTQGAKDVRNILHEWFVKKPNGSLWVMVVSATVFASFSIPSIWMLWNGTPKAEVICSWIIFGLIFAASLIIFLRKLQSTQNGDDVDQKMASEI